MFTAEEPEGVGPDNYDVIASAVLAQLNYGRAFRSIDGKVVRPLRVDIRPKMMSSLGRMPSQNNPDDRIALLQGTLDLLILKTLVLGPCHGQGIARSIQRQSEEVFFVDHGSLYLALQRLEDKKWISAKWGVSANNRKARFYSLTAKGRQQLVEKTSEWQRLTRAMGLILDGRARSEEVS